MILFLFVLFSCKNARTGNSAGLDTTAINQLAGRVCRAIQIRKQRFSLANSIRFTQDTLATAITPTEHRRLQTRLDDYLKQKTVLFRESVTLADTIHRQMDSIVPYTDKAKEKAFNARLNSLLAQKGCTAGS